MPKERRNNRDLGAVDEGDGEKRPCEPIRLEPVRVSVAVLFYINDVLFEVEKIYIFFFSFFFLYKRMIYLPFRRNRRCSIIYVSPPPFSLPASTEGRGRGSSEDLFVFPPSSSPFCAGPSRTGHT